MSGTVPRISVTELARRSRREGDLGRSQFSLLRGVEGIRTHQRLQRDRGPDYQAEVPVSFEWESRCTLHGRIDGLESTPDGPVLEEIKTTRAPMEPSPDESVHRTQLRCYAWMWWRLYGNLPGLRLIYAHPRDDRNQRRIEWTETPDELDREMAGLMEDLLRIQREQEAWIIRRNETLRGLSFPHDSMRPGQAELIDTVEEGMSSGGRIYVQAPTGIGKTLGVLVPALRGLGRDDIGTLMIATNRNAGKLVFEDALRLLADRGAKLRAVSLVARDRICREAGVPCNCTVCPLALKFYERLPVALDELRALEGWEPEAWRDVANRHRLCPFAFMMHAAREADVLLGDLNYALDPSARLEFLFGAGPERVGLLVDEAHHLPDRARSMLTGQIDPARIQSLLRDAPGEGRGVLSDALRPVTRAVRSYVRESVEPKGLPVPDQPPPAEVAKACRDAAAQLEGLEIPDMDAALGSRFLDVLRMLWDFSGSVERRQESHVCHKEGGALIHRCLDASDWLRERFREIGITVLFSATLEPMDAFRRLTGADPENRDLRLETPFHPDQFHVSVETSLPLVWRARTPELFDKLAALISRTLSAAPVKTLIYFPSYALLEEVARRLPDHDLWFGPVLKQPRGLQEREAEAFLRPFRQESGPVTALAVLGGVLNEGIDLPGKALERVIVVSIGLPAVCPERELMRGWYDARGEEGFILAYTLPGLVRVRQALGRVVRSPEDEGTALLIDPRFTHPIYRDLFG